MKPRIGVLGLWHLGCVTAACLARHVEVTGLDFDGDVVAKLREARAPLFEPGLNELIAAGLKQGRLSFSEPNPENIGALDLLWLTYDTPVDEDDRSDAEFVLSRFHRIAGYLREGALVVISSQLPAGTCRRLEKEYVARKLQFACVPENLRLGQAIEIFTRPDRIVAGVRDAKAREILAHVFEPLGAPIVWMTPESAEMTKHALNAFLAVSITFMNEIARLCEQVGADAREVSEGLKSEARIGPRAYLAPGAAFAGGTLARDVVSLLGIAAGAKEDVKLLPSIQPSNEAHKLWAWRTLAAHFPDLRGRTIALFGLTYKPNTDTLRRSAAIELARRLIAAGAKVKAWDPVVRLVPELPEIELAVSAPAALKEADALVIATPWPQFREENWNDLLGAMAKPLVLDAGRFLERQLPAFPGVVYLSVGKPHEA